MKKNIVIVSCMSTGMNYPEDILKRGYNPVIIDVDIVGTEESASAFLAGSSTVSEEGFPVIKDYGDYDTLLERVREFDPVLVVAGSEFGVPYSVRLADDLGLPGNPSSLIPAMTEKAAMHEALKNYGIRYIHGELIGSAEEARAAFERMGSEDCVIKWTRGAATQGLHICHSWEQVQAAVEQSLSNPFMDEGKPVALLMQERIHGEEYIVNTVSLNGKHRVTSIWHYNKVETDDGSYIYNYCENVGELNVGHSRMIRYAFDVLDAIGIQNGPVHGEYMIDENGPVLIEVNCRPMGENMARKYLEGIYEHHETDEILDTFLEPNHFEERQRRFYRAERKGAFKFFILKENTNVESAPVFPIARRLRSYYSASLGWMGSRTMLPKTTDLENSGGTIYLMHEDEKVVMRDIELLHLLEMKYPRILFGNRAKEELEPVAPCDIEAVMEATGCQQTTLVFSDREQQIKNAIVADENNLSNTFDGFEQGVLDLTRPETFVDLENIIDLIYRFTDKIKEGGRVIVPESTYANLPYGIEGMEILFRVAGLRIEMPLSGDGRVLIGSI